MAPWPGWRRAAAHPVIQHTALVHCWPARLETTHRGRGNVPQADGHVCHAAVCSGSLCRLPWAHPLKAIKKKMSPSVTASLLWTQMGTLLLCLFHLLFPISPNLRTSWVPAAWWEMPPVAVLYSCRADLLLRAPIPVTWLVPIWGRNWVIKAFWGSCVVIHNCFRGNPFQAAHVHRHSFTLLLRTHPGPVLSSRPPSNMLLPAMKPTPGSAWKIFTQQNIPKASKPLAGQKVECFLWATSLSSPLFPTLGVIWTATHLSGKSSLQTQPRWWAGWDYGTRLEPAHAHPESNNKSPAGVTVYFRFRNAA